MITLENPAMIIMRLGVAPRNPTCHRSGAIHHLTAILDKGYRMNLIQSNSVTMSSLELADLTGKAHKHVLVDIRSMLTELEIDWAGLSAQYQDSTGRWLPCFNLDRELTDTLLTGYSAKMRLAVIRRWRELEEGQSPKLPQTFSEALRLAAEQAEQIEQQQLLIEQQKPAVEFVEKYVDGTGLKGFRQVAKLLQAKEHQFREFLVDQKIQYRLGGEWCAYQNHIEAGRFEVKTGTAQNSEHVFNEAKFTPKGVNWIAGIWAQHNIKSNDHE